MIIILSLGELRCADGGIEGPEEELVSSARPDPTTAYGAADTLLDALEEVPTGLLTRLGITDGAQGSTSEAAKCVPSPPRSGPNGLMLLEKSFAAPVLEIDFNRVQH